MLYSTLTKNTNVSTRASSHSPLLEHSAPGLSDEWFVHTTEHQAHEHLDDDQGAGHVENPTAPRERAGCWAWGRAGLGAGLGPGWAEAGLGWAKSSPWAVAFLTS